MCNIDLKFKTYRGTNKKPRKVHIKPHQAMEDKVLGGVNSWIPHRKSPGPIQHLNPVSSCCEATLINTDPLPCFFKAREHQKHGISFQRKTVGCQNHQNSSSKTAQRVVKIYWAVVYHDWDYGFSVWFQKSWLWSDEDKIEYVLCFSLSNTHTQKWKSEVEKNVFLQ